MEYAKGFRSTSELEETYRIKRSFTYYHLKLSDFIISNPDDKNLNKLSDETIMNLLLNVFPDGNTFLHLIADNTALLSFIF